MTDKAALNECGVHKFFADAMLGKLARWMRVLGYDVAYERYILDDELIRRCVEEDRIILTRDTLLIKRRRARGRSFLIESDHVDEQLKQVVERYKIDDGCFLTRCIRCNILLDDVEKRFVEDKVPPYVFKTQERFSVCFQCGRIYWAGTHRGRMEEDIEKLLNEDS